MGILEIEQKLEDLDLFLSLDEGDIIVKSSKDKNPNIAIFRKDYDLQNAIKEFKPKIIERLKGSVNGIQAIYNLSGMQEGMLFHSLYSENNEAYFEQLETDLKSIDPELLKSAWTQLLKKYTVFRTSFDYNSFNRPVQVVHSNVSLPFKVFDLTNDGLDDQMDIIDTYKMDDIGKGFDMRKPPLMRVAIFKLSAEDYRMVWSSHHILFDGWSLQTILSSLKEAYESLRSGKISSFDEDCYEDFIKYIEQRDKKASLHFWKSQMEKIEEACMLPFIASSGTRNAGEGVYKEMGQVYAGKEFRKLKDFVADQQITLNTFLQGCWALTLHTFTQQERVLFGVTVSGRPYDLADVENKVGLYINTIPLISELPKTDLPTWLRNLQDTQFNSREFQYESLSEVIKLSGNKKQDLFDTLLVYENYPKKFDVTEEETLSFNNITVKEKTNYPLTLIVSEHSDQIYLDLSYNASLIDDEYVRAVKNTLGSIAHGLIESRTTDYFDLNTLSRKQLQFWSDINDTINSVVKESTIIDAFEEIASLQKNGSAVVHQNSLLTYEELSIRSNQLSQYLTKKGVREEMLVPISIDRSLEMIIGMLAILKAGGAYVPIDPDYPEDRIRFILEDTGSTILLTSAAYHKKTSEIHVGEIVVLDKIHQELSKESDDPVTARVTPENLAYVIYTSGSTGRPKGVMVDHKNVVSLVQGPEYVSSTDQDSILSTSSTSFDAATFEYWSALLNGGKLIFMEKNEVLSPNSIRYHIKENNVSKLFLTTGLFNQLVDSDPTIFRHLKYVLFGGNLASLKRINLLKESNVDGLEIIHVYGPTENTTFSTSCNLNKIGDHVAPIGKPLLNRLAYLLDDRLKLVPVGVEAELYLGGAGLSLGYLNQPELTKERFIPNPFDGGLTKLYKTGDLARMLPDGNIEFIGRRDHQVKIRGYRIELGEIETILGKYPGLSQSLVETSLDSAGERQLVGYIKEGESEFDREAVESYLSEFLPAYMVPRLWVELPVFPLTSNGKLDRAALPKPEGSAYSSTKYVGPKDEMEHGLQSLWSTLLESEEIGIASDFFELGGHSLMVIRMLSHVRSMYGKEVSIGSFFESPTISSLAEKIRQDDARVEQTLERDSRATRPLSYSQERLWFIDQLEGSTQYHVPWLMKLSGELDINKLETSLRFLVGRHEPLHTVIEECDGELTLGFLDPSQWNIDRYSVSGKEGAEIEELRIGLVSKPFELSTDYLFRGTLLEYGADQYELILVFHHISFDGWSQGVFERELMTLYAYGSSGLAPMPVSYSDYSIWQRAELSGARLDTKLDYWRSHLSGGSILELPTDKPRPKRRITSGGIESMTLGVARSEIRDYCLRHGVTPYMYFLSVFKVLLHRYSGQEDICVGSPVAGRTHRELESMIGFFVNTVAVRSSVSSGERFVDFQARLKQTLLELYAYQDVPFEKVVEAVVEEREQNVTPIFQVMFVHQGFEEETFSLNELEIDRISVPHESSKFDLTMIVTEEVGKVRLSLEYSTSLYQRSTIIRMLGHFEELVQSTFAIPECEVGDLSLVTSKEREQLLHEFNATQVAYPKSTTLVSLLEASSLSHADANAVVYEDENLTYGELREYSNELSHYLIERGVGIETLVPICIDRSLKMIIGILGILKAGGAYVPIDPNYPEDRIKYILEDTGSSILLTNEAYKEKFEEIYSGEIVVLDEIERELFGKPRVCPDLSLSPRNLAYVIYTSGSTGRPKGVMVEHNSIVNYLLSSQDHYKGPHLSGSSLSLSLSFDAALTSIFIPLISGKSLIIPNSELDFFLNAEAINSHKPYDFIKITPQQLSTLDKTIINELTDKMILGGESLKWQHLQNLDLSESLELINEYGPTEATIGSSIYCFKINDSTKFDRGTVPIGKSISNTQIYLLDQQLELVPFGITGELFIGGAGLSRGYLNQPDLTKERFIPNPFDGGLTRLYKTGDLARMLPDGNIEFIGRRDHQVKVRGYRIELGEIEAVLGRFPGLSQSLVETSLDSTGERQLVGYIKEGESEFDREAVESYLLEFLPAYMVPRLWVEVADFPLTSNGKLDRAALPKPEGTVYSSTKYVGPRDEMEHGLQSLWHTLLESEEIGIASNFFELGGHSLMVIRMLSHVRSMYGKEVSIGSFFESPTIGSLAEKIRQDTARVEQALERDSRATRPLSYSQERLWFIDQLEGSTQYHVPWLMKLSGELDINKLETSLRFLVGRHEPLHTVIEECDVELTLRFLDPSLWEMGRRSVAGQDSDGMALIRRDLVSEPFDLTTDYLLRCTLLERGADQYELILVFHHISFDGWSQGVFERELMKLYAQGSGVLAPMRVSYSDYSIWQRGELSGQRLEEKLTYWREQLGGVSVLELPTDKARPKRRSTSGGMERKTLGVSQSQVRDYCVRHGVTPYMYFLSVFKVLLHRYSGQEDLCVGSPVAGRTHREMESMVGLFVNTVAVRSTMSSSDRFVDFQARLKQRLLELYAYQDVPFEKVVEAVVEERELSVTPVFQVMFVHQGFEEEAFSLDGVKVDRGAVPHDTNKFDLTVIIVEEGEHVRLLIKYSSDLYESATILRMLGHFEELVKSTMATPEREVGDLQLLSTVERKELLYEFNDTQVSYPSSSTLVDLLEGSSVSNSEAIAVVYEESTLTYGELRALSNQLSHHLIKRGVGVETMVPICIDRSLEMIVGILGILKAGGAYVPIDPEYPEDRIRYMLSDTGSSLILTSTQNEEKIRKIHTGEILVLDGGEQMLSEESTDLPDIDVGPDNLAYVIYTSGSTGRPKGVTIEHRNLVNYIHWFHKSNQHLDLSSSLLFSSFTFDGVYTSVFGTLLFGGTLYIPSKQIIHDSDRLLDYIHQRGITFLKITPSYLRLLIQNQKFETVFPRANRLNLLVIGGESIFVSDLRKIAKIRPDIRLINHYGPTETTVGICAFPIEISELESFIATPVVGMPICNTRIYILNRSLKMVPQGCIGEVCVSGAGLARGYLNKEELTSKTFVSNPFEPGQKLYRTGDLGRWRPDGSLQLMGRKDDQVKVRGYRIELEEINQVLRQHPNVQDGVVDIKLASTGQNTLVGYVVKKDPKLDKETLHWYLNQVLPQYMIPTQWVFIQEVPLTTTGKIDRNKLPELQSEISDKIVSPQNEVERKLVEIWEGLLVTSGIGIESNFFALGGDSIIAIQLVSKARGYGMNLTIRDVFEYQTIAQLAKKLDVRSESVYLTEQGNLAGKAGLLPIQKWFLRQHTDHLNHFNQSQIFSIEKAIKPKDLSFAIHSIVAYHDALRFRYSFSGDEWNQTYDENQFDTLSQFKIDLPEQKRGELSKRITDISNSFQIGFDLQRGTLIKFAFIQTPSWEPYNRLLVIAHHLVIDAVSWRIIQNDLEHLLTDLIKNQKPSLPAKGTSFRQWVEVLNNWGRSIGKEDLDYWKHVPIYREVLPVDGKLSKHQQNGSFKSLRSTLPVALTRKLLTISENVSLSMNEILIATLIKTMSVWSQSRQISITLENHGREEINEQVDTHRTVGWFTTLFPFSMDLTGREEWLQLLKAVKENLQCIPNKGLGFGLYEFLDHGNQFSEMPELTFNYLGKFENTNRSDQFVKLSDEFLGQDIGSEFQRREKISLTAFTQDNSLSIIWNYSGNHFHQESVQHVSRLLLDNLQEVIDFGKQLSEVMVPSDYGLSKYITTQEFDDFLDENKLKENLDSIFRLTPMQEGIIFHAQYDSSQSAYVEQYSCEFERIDLELLIRAWNLCLQKFEILRTSVSNEAFKVPVQWVMKDIELSVQTINLIGLGKEEAEQQYHTFLQKDKERGFVFEQGPLMRITIFLKSDTRSRMLWTYHHVLLDGWSSQIVIDELLQFYEFLSQGREISITKDRFSEYSDYVYRTDLQASKVFWKSKISLVSNPSLLPQIEPNANRNAGAGNYQFLSACLDEVLTKRIRTFIGKEKITINTLFQGCWAILLSKILHQDKVIFGATVSGRPHDFQGVENRVGLFINTIPTIIEVNNDPTGRWLRNIQKAQLESREYQYDSLPEILAMSELTGELFDTLFIYQNYPERPVVKSDNRYVVPEYIEVNEHTNYPLTVLFGEYQKEIIIAFSFNSDLLVTRYVDDLSKSLKSILLQIIEGVDTVNHLELLDTSQKRAILNINKNQIPFDQTRTVLDLFTDHARKFPRRTAVTIDDQELSYQLLDELSNQVAHYLINQGIATNSHIPICFDREVNMIIAMFGVMKCGASYVPIDPKFPRKRIAYQLEDIHARLVLTSVANQELFDDFSSLSAIDLEEVLSSSMVDESSNNWPSLEDTAYVIYTSGTTGDPKGVMVPHSALLNLCQSIQHIAPVEGPFTHAMWCSYSFDVSCYEIFFTLSHGGTLIITPENEREDPESFVKWIHENNVEVVYLPKYALEPFIAIVEKEPTTVRRMLLGVEPIPTELVQKLKEVSPEIDVVNGYGPTETTICATFYLFESCSSSIVPIGKPIANVQVYLLDSDMQLVLNGVEGEIYIGGAGLSNGYLNKETLTSEKFITNPFDEKHKIYKTGDIGKRLPDGNIRFVGRRDQQVKIRGYRIELGEIEASLTEHPLVAQAVVHVQENVHGDSMLTGYVISEGEFNARETENYLAQLLPEYMVPRLWVQMEEFPMTLNGKLDRDRLPKPDFVTGGGDFLVRPRDEMEQELSLIWGEVLGQDEIGIFDDFFQRGGHSLKAVQLLSAVRKLFQIEISLKDFFQTPTIDFIGSQIRRGGAESTSEEIYSTDNSGPSPLSFAQEGMWFIDKLQGSFQYHINWMLSLDGKLDVNALERSFRAIVQRHEVLRSVVLENEGRQELKVKASEQWRLKEVKEEDIKIKSLEEAKQTALNEPFNLAEDYLLRVHLFHLGDQRRILLLIVHHMAFDGWSLGILKRELQTLYGAYKNDVSIELAPVSMQYSDYSTWQKSYLSEDTLKNKLKFWAGELNGAPILKLPLDKPRPEFHSTEGDTVFFNAKPAMYSKLRAFCRKEKVTSFMYFLSALKVLLHRLTGQDDIVVGAPITGRAYHETHNTIGLFVNTLVIRSIVDRDLTFSQLLSAVKSKLISSFEHQDTPFDKIVEQTTSTRNMSYTPVFQVRFVYQTDEESIPLLLDGLTTTSEPIGKNTSKFDLSVKIFETSDDFKIGLEYCTELFQRSTIEKWCNYYLQLVDETLASPKKPIGGLKFFHGQRLPLKHEVTEIPREETLVNEFSSIVAQYSDRTAIVQGNETMNYGALDDLSTQLAKYLFELKLVDESKIPIYFEHSFEMVICMLGVLKSGHAFVPIDISFPKDRVKKIIEETQSPIILTAPQYRNILMEFADCRKILSLDDVTVEERNSDTEFNLPELTREKLAYVIYTSGSTGEPKGVEVCHGNLLNYIRWSKREFLLNEKDTFLMTSSFAFDLIYTTLFGSLFSGATLHLINSQQYLEPEVLERYIRDHQITFLKVTPSLFSLLVNDSDFSTQSLKSVKYILLGGERIETNTIEKVLHEANWIQFVNHYGPTEAAVGCVFHKIERNNWQQFKDRPVIGKPISNATCYVLDEEGELLPEGLVGELAIGGEGIARGYFNHESLTTQKFIYPNFDPSLRLYKTGDLCRILHDGNIEMIGRVDEQVKVKGFRVELGEIESVLMEHNAIDKAAVCLLDGNFSQKRLAGYVKKNQLIEVEEIEEFLAVKLPNYMIPRIWIELEEFSFKLNGKVNKRALPIPNEEPDIVAENEEDISEIHKALIKIWKEVLEVENISIHDDFFSLGGESLSVVIMASQLKETFQKKLTLQEIMANSTISQLASLIENDVVKKDEHHHIVEFVVSDSNQNIFLLPGSTGLTESYGDLAFALSSKFKDHSIYGIVFRGLKSDEQPCMSARELSDFCLTAIKKVQPHGPYFLIGHSLGGTLLHDMVARLEQQKEFGHKVVVIDALPYLRGGNISDQNLLDQVADYMFNLLMKQSGLQNNISLEEIKRILLDGLKDDSFHSNSLVSLFEDISDNEKWRVVLQYVNLLIFNSLFSFQPKEPVNSSIYIIKAAENNRDEADYQQWSMFSRGYMFHESEGTHETIVTEYAPQLADKISKIF